MQESSFEDRVKTVNLITFERYCNFGDERNNNYHNRVGIGLQYKNHILWNKGNPYETSRSATDLF